MKTLNRSHFSFLALFSAFMVCSIFCISTSQASPLKSCKNYIKDVYGSSTKKLILIAECAQVIDSNYEGESGDTEPTTYQVRACVYRDDRFWTPDGNKVRYGVLGPYTYKRDGMGGSYAFSANAVLEGHDPESSVERTDSTLEITDINNDYKIDTKNYAYFDSSSARLVYKSSYREGMFRSWKSWKPNGSFLLGCKVLNSIQ